ncbi:peptidase inhibitor family I36 protein [Spirillospora sp. NPDC050679]
MKFTHLRRGVALAAASALAVTGSVVTAPASFAASCPSGYVCFWADLNYTGTPWRVTANGTRHPAPSWFRDRASSLITGPASAGMTMYNDPDCTWDPSVTFNSNVRVPDLRAGWVNYDNIMSCVSA